MATEYSLVQFNDNRDRPQVEVRNKDPEQPFPLDLSQPNTVSTWAAILHSLRYSHYRLLDDEYREICCRHDINRIFIAKADESYIMAIAQDGQSVSDEDLNWHTISDGDKSLLKQIMQDTFGKFAQDSEKKKVKIPKLSNEALQDAINLVGSIHQINPRTLYFRRALSKHPEYADRLGWDGKPRVDSFLKRAGCTVPEYIEIDRAGSGYVDTYLEAVSKTIFFGAVERNIADPEKGTIVDIVPIIIGDGGTGKSSMLETIADRGKLHSGAGPIVSSKGTRNAEHHFFDPVKSMLIGELIECTQMRNDSIEDLKTYISKSYGKYGDLHKEAAKHPITSVFVGTTNRRDVLKDGNGNRRFAPVEMMGLNAQKEHGIIQVKDWPDYEIEQLWAEAYYRVINGESWRDDWNGKPDCKIVQQAYCRDSLEESDFIPHLVELIDNELKVQEGYPDISRISAVPCVPVDMIHRAFKQEYHSTARIEDLENAYRAVKNDSKNKEENKYGFYIRPVRTFDKNGKIIQPKCFVRVTQANRKG